MAIKASEWKPSKYPYIKVNKKERSLYLFDVRSDNGKRYRKQYRHINNKNINTIFLEWRAKLGLETTEGAQTVYDYFVLSQKYSDRNDTTKQMFKLYFNNYCQAIRDMKVSEVKSSHIDQLSLANKHLSRSYRRKLFDLLTPLFRIAIDDEIIDRSPIKSRQVVKRKQMEEKRVVTNAVQKYKDLHKAIHEVFKDEPRLRALFLFGFYGRRKTETLHLKWSDIHGNKYTVRGSISKVNTDMTFVMPDDLRSALKLFMSVSDVYVFQNTRSVEPRPINEIREHVLKIRKGSGIGDFTFHLMRNICVSALSTSGIDSIYLSSQLGHLDTATLQKYLSLQRESSSQVVNEVSAQLLMGVNI